MNLIIIFVQSAATSRLQKEKQFSRKNKYLQQQESGWDFSAQQQHSFRHFLVLLFQSAKIINLLSQHP